MDKKILTLVSLSLILYSRAQTVQATRQTPDSTAISSFPVFSTDASDGENEPSRQEIASLLQASKDPFTQFAGFQVGTAGYRMRGLSSENQQVMVNGVNVANPANGISSWSSWGGLNDVTRFVETRIGNESSRYGFSGAGGYTNIDSRASSFRKGTRLSLSGGNRAFRSRVMVTHTTGPLRNGWSMAFSASTRDGNQVYLPGTFFNGKSVYVSVDKKFGDNRLLSFTGFVASVEQGRARAATAEAFALAGSHYYNSAWGYQAGKVRNSNVSTSSLPTFQLSYQVQKTRNLRLTTTLMYQAGKTGYTSLGYYKTVNPKPDYYRYLPSFFYLHGDSIAGDAAAASWAQNDQVNWDRLVALNQANLYAPAGSLGTNGRRARYILQNDAEQQRNLVLNALCNYRHRNWFISGGANSTQYSVRKYAEVADLLGADYWIDVDQFAENLGVEEFYQLNDIDNPGRLVRKGDRFGYDYALKVERAEAWSQAEYSRGRIDAYLGASGSLYSVMREGFVANGKFPDNSKGNGERLSFRNGGLKGGVTCKFSGRQFLSLKGSLLSRPPETANLYVAPRVRQDAVAGAKSEKVYSGEVSYVINSPAVRLRATAYDVAILDQTIVRSYWHDDYHAMVNLVMKGVNEDHRGIELGLERPFLNNHSVQLSAGVGQWVYTNRPLLDAWQDNNSAQLFRDRRAFLRNYRVGGSAQTVLGVGYRYAGRTNWWASASLNYLDGRFVAVNPDRRTAEAIANYSQDDTEQVRKITSQEKLPPGFLLNFAAYKPLRLYRRYNASVSASVNNALNNTSFILSGFEQMRWDKTYLDQFPNKYTYLTGTTFMVSLAVNL